MTYSLRFTKIDVLEKKLFYKDRCFVLSLKKIVNFNKIN